MKVHPSASICDDRIIPLPSTSITIAMTPLKLTTSLLGLVLVGLAAATALTNPDQAAYERFAAQKLGEYLQEDTCAKAGIALQAPCNSLVKSNQSQIQNLISANTQRQNFLFLSIYKTDLVPGELLPDFLSGALPSYHFETAGILSSFHVYKVEKQ
ncbi:MAG: DUF4359 domain-containing protein [Oscillatoriophycideae cyanobacterium NC_groundwater_1537_Pr4_S-0.65um_50_18]|nr:DUF4359 domain-containing protein [Oscillatoriophycideae cyanobacterium NC_groundwater_1537_Pr4_S-0.65um_50_18]